MIGILTEDSDRVPLKLLLNKIGVRPVVIGLGGRGNVLDEGAVKRHTQALLSRHTKIRKVIILVDGNCHVQQTRADATKLEQSLQNSDLRVPPEYFVVEHELESWLAASRDAMLAANIRQSHRPSQADLHRAKEYLKKAFRRVGKPYLQTRDNEFLAKNVAVDQLADENPNFRLFRDTVKG